MLTRVLDSHSAIAAPCEIPIPKYFKGDPSERLVDNKLRAICAYYHTAFPVNLEEFNRTVAEILRQERKRMLIIKYPRHALFLESIAKDFPDARYIHLVRDIRSVALSSMYENKPTIAFRKWYDFNTTALKTLDQLSPTRKHFVRYEDIVENPFHFVVRIVEFLSQDFEPEILDYGRFSHADDNMRLWWNRRPQETSIHQHLRHGRIVKLDQPPPSQAVETIYNQTACFKRLNQSFGYR